MWTIYRRPRDYPIFYVVRRWFIGPDQLVPDPDVRLAIDLDEARAHVPRWTCRIPRQGDEDSCVVESWV